MIEKIAGMDDTGKRFDVVARAAFPMLPLGQIFTAIRKGKLTLNGVKASPQQRIISGDRLEYRGVYVELSKQDVNYKLSPWLGSEIPVLWQNEDLIAVNKPQGIKVHDGENSLVAWLKQYISQNYSLSFSPGPCHRLDRNTTGVIILAKTVLGARAFAKCQEKKALKKVYIGILKGHLKTEMRWESQLHYHQGRVQTQVQKGLWARTNVWPLAWSLKQKSTLALFYLDTGRTHQIRAQAQQAGVPLLGDSKYQGGSGLYFLHACFLCDTSSEELFPPLWAPLPRSWHQPLRDFALSEQAIRQKIRALYGF